MADTYEERMAELEKIRAHAERQNQEALNAPEARAARAEFEETGELRRWTPARQRVAATRRWTAGRAPRRVYPRLSRARAPRRRLRARSGSRGDPPQPPGEESEPPRRCLPRLAAYWLACAGLIDVAFLAFWWSR